ncbi:MAG: NADPH-dependent glutamate synthase [Candidatus Heimdallarchaeota archaeon]|nr:NADPH-dependent glutamate synthase [Candidatus Heimdallarchaeota archaeon]MCK4876448.1 NADPH-dependent glutamate synthase [Candidatus Heimdallarchaeota archaeon]
MPTQNPEDRIDNFSEVPYGYNEAEAMLEAQRCLQCKNQPCVSGCPVEVPIRDFIILIREGKFMEAAVIIKTKNSLPAVTGRVCPQELQCESKCVMGRRYQPVAIGNLERFAADYAREEGEKIPELPKSTGKKIAVVGAGPAGLTCAGDLALHGHNVTIFEALHEPGGVLVYGIPEFRLPKDMVKYEIEYLVKLGVEVKLNFLVGKNKTVEELLNEYDAVFVGSGAGAPRLLNIPGINLVNVYSANEYLTRVNLLKGYLFPEYKTPVKRGRSVVVIGAGNVAMDSARTAKRLGAEHSIIVYRRSRKECPARVEEVHHAEEEEIEFRFLTNPVRIIGDELGAVRAVECLQFELGEPDETGRAKPIPIPGSEHLIECDVVVISVGNDPNPIIPRTTPDLEISKWGTIVTDRSTGKTSKEGVYAGGDIATGAATVIAAMGAGKIAAKNIHKQVMGIEETEIEKT